MQDNIDLTKNRDFPDRSRNFDAWIISNRILRIPWRLKLMSCDLDLRIRNDKLFPTGSKPEILSSLEVNKAASDDYCDRCGASLKIIPWNPLSDLCEECRKIVRSQYKGPRNRMIPWKTQKTLW